MSVKGDTTPFAKKYAWNNKYTKDSLTKEFADRGGPRYPESTDYIDEKCKAMIKRMLKVNVSERITLKEIKKHPYFTTRPNESPRDNADARLWIKLNNDHLK